MNSPSDGSPDPSFRRSVAELSLRSPLFAAVASLRLRHSHPMSTDRNDEDMKNIPPNVCDTDRLRLLLADQLPESLQEEVAEHVAQCESCRRTLESFAGDAGWWSEVESCFRANAEQIGESTNVAHSLGDPQL